MTATNPFVHGLTSVAAMPRTAGLGWARERAESPLGRAIACVEVRVQRHAAMTPLSRELTEMAVKVAKRRREETLRLRDQRADVPQER